MVKLRAIAAFDESGQIFITTKSTTQEETSCSAGNIYLYCRRVLATRTNVTHNPTERVSITFLKGPRIPVIHEHGLTDSRPLNTAGWLIALSRARYMRADECD